MRKILLSLILTISFSFLLLPINKVKGETVGDEINLNVSGEKLDIAIENDGDLHLSYKRGSTVFYLRQVNGSWNAERTVEGSSTTYNSRWYPHIAVDSSGNAHFTWADIYMTHLYYTSFTNNAWTGLYAAVTDSGSGADTNRCDITVDINDNVFVAGQSDYGIECNKKVNGGGWQGEQSLFSNSSEPKSPSLCASKINSQVFCVYSWGNPGLQYNVYNGTNWGAASRPGSEGQCCPNYNNVTTDYDGFPHIAWIRWDGDTGYSDLLYINQNPNGQWSSPVTLFSSPYFFYCPSDECTIPQIEVAADGTVIVVYANGYGSSKVKYFLKDASTGDWSGPTLITTGSTYQNYPALAVNGNTFYVAWSDNRSGDTIYYRTIETVPLPDPLDPPVLDIAEVVGQQVFLSWTPPVDPDSIIDHYIVSKGGLGGKWTPIAETTNTFYYDNDVSKKGVYLYRIKVVDIYNRTSEPSNTMQVVYVTPSITLFGFLIVFILLSLLLFKSNNLLSVRH